MELEKDRLYVAPILAARLSSLELYGMRAWLVRGPETSFHTNTCVNVSQEGKSHGIGSFVETATFTSDC